MLLDEGTSFWRQGKTELAGHKLCKDGHQKLGSGIRSILGHPGLLNILALMKAKLPQSNHKGDVTS